MLPRLSTPGVYLPDGTYLGPDWEPIRRFFEERGAILIEQPQMDSIEAVPDGSGVIFAMGTYGIAPDTVNYWLSRNFGVPAASGAPPAGSVLVSRDLDRQDEWNILSDIVAPLAMFAPAAIGISGIADGFFAQAPTAAASSEAAFVAADASQLAAQGLGAAQIEQTLLAAGVESFVAADAAQLAAQGISGAQLSGLVAQSSIGLPIFSAGAIGASFPLTPPTPPTMPGTTAPAAATPATVATRTAGAAAGAGFVDKVVSGAKSVVSGVASGLAGALGVSAAAHLAPKSPAAQAAARTPADSAGAGGLLGSISGEDRTKLLLLAAAVLGLVYVGSGKR